MANPLAGKRFKVEDQHAEGEVVPNDRLDPAAQANSLTRAVCPARLSTATKPSASRSARPRDLADLQIPQAAR